MTPDFELQFKIKKKFGTQFSFAQKVGDTENSVSRAIRGRRILRDVEKRRWAAALDADPKELFSNG